MSDTVSLSPVIHPELEIARLFILSSLDGYREYFAEASSVNLLPSSAKNF